MLAELDYLIGQRVGHEAQMALLGEVVRGVYQLDSFAAEDVDRASEITGAVRRPANRAG